MNQENSIDLLSKSVSSLFDANAIKGRRIKRLERAVDQLTINNRRLGLGLICFGVFGFITIQEVKRLHQEVEELKSMKGE